jgi:site-specific DNA-methyltransferase (adenine-specific)
MRLLNLPISEIKISEDRQRKGLGGDDEKKGQVSFEELKGSLRERGLINPPRVDEGNNLIAGFRRLKAWEALGNTHIMVTVADGELSELDKELMELEENTQRLDLTWQEKQRTIARIDEIRRKQDPNWNQAKTAAVAGLNSQSKVSEAVTLTKMMDIFPEIAKAKTKRQAESMVKQKAKTLVRVEQIKANPDMYKSAMQGVRQGKAEELIRALESGSISHIVTDGPFGIDYDQRQAGTNGAHEAYQDTPESYRERTFILANEMFRVLQDDAFLVWFLAHDHFDWTREVFRSAGFAVDPVPLVWDRSEGRNYTVRPDRWFGKAYDIALHCIKGDPQMQVRSRPGGNVFKFKPVSSSDKDHIVERPPELYAEIIKCISVPGELILDLFGGSGSVGAAAVSTGRRQLTFELNPNHIPTIVTKIANYTPQVVGSITPKEAAGAK